MTETPQQRERVVDQENEQLDALVTTLSRELRNPLNVASGHLQLAMEQSNNEHLEHVADAHERLKEIIGDLLVLAHSKSDPETMESIELARQVKQSWESEASEDATLITQTTRLIQADEKQLRRLLENLIRNAVEHGGQSVTVTVGELPDGFFFEDNGKGFPDLNHEKLLEPGVSTIDGRNGFGLSIVQNIADAHGWDIKLTESSEGGARIAFTGLTTTPSPNRPPEPEAVRP